MKPISGTWLGTFWQLKHPTRFEVTFIQTQNTLLGTLLDDGHLGEASLTGEIVGRQIQFHKRYLIKSHYTIVYSGTLSEDGDRMQGRWWIGQFKLLSPNAGDWEAHRINDDLNLELSRLQQSSQPRSQNTSQFP